MPKKKTDKDSSTSNKDLENFDIKINEFGEISSNIDIDKLNTFLNENVEDKKFKDIKEEDIENEEKEE